jgi:phenylacetate-CoA ligase
VLNVWVDRLEREHRLGAAWRGDGFPAVPGGSTFPPWCRTAMLWGKTHVVKGWWQALSGPVRESLFQRRVLDCFTLDDQKIELIYNAMRAMRPRRVLGYVTALAEVARFGLERGWAPLTIEKVVPTAEQLDEGSSDLIARLFRGPQRQRYGCREAGDIAAQCEHGSWHLYSDFLYPEVLLADGTIAREGTGTLLLTKLHNRVMPLVRYDIEDVVTLGGPDCDCGRPLPVMRSIDGRYIDQLVCADGSRVNGLAVPRVLRGISYHEFQAVQDRPGHCVVYLIPRAEFEPEQVEIIKRNWIEYIGPGISYELELVDSIARSGSGKRRQVVSRFS